MTQKILSVGCAVFSALGLSVVLPEGLRGTVPASERSEVIAVFSVGLAENDEFPGLNKCSGLETIKVDPAGQARAVKSY